MHHSAKLSCSSEVTLMQLDEHEMLSETAAAISDPLTFFTISMSIKNCIWKCRETDIERPSSPDHYNSFHSRLGSHLQPRVRHVCFSQHVHRGQDEPGDVEGHVTHADNGHGVGVETRGREAEVRVRGSIIQRHQVPSRHHPAKWLSGDTCNQRWCHQW